VLRVASTTLYTSLFRYDDEIMVNPHAYGEPASANPTLHLRRLDGGQQDSCRNKPTYLIFTVTMFDLVAVNQDCSGPDRDRLLVAQITGAARHRPALAAASRASAIYCRVTYRSRSHRNGHRAAAIAQDASPRHIEGVVAELYDDETEGEVVEGETDDEPVEGETDDGEAGPEEITSATPTAGDVSVPAEGVDWITSPWGAGDSWNEYVARLRPCSASVDLA
jgi:hypothetical protein